MKLGLFDCIAACGLLLTFGLAGCKQSEPVKARIPINFFSMQVNGQPWKPYQNPTDSCMGSTFGATQSELQYASGKVVPFYTFSAYRDPSGQANAYSENLFVIRVMNVTEPGIYLLDGTYKEDFDSHIMFQMQRPTGGLKRYVNNPTRRPFVVYVQELLPIKDSPTKGVRGSFAGVLYNESNQSDSLVIEKGNFTFALVNYPDNCGF